MSDKAWLLVWGGAGLIAFAPMCGDVVSPRFYRWVRQTDVRWFGCRAWFALGWIAMMTAAMVFG
jgi:hypothetical protein